MKIHNEEFFQRDDVVAISRDLIGMTLCSEMDGVVTGGPGLVSQALGLTTLQNGISLIESGKIWLEPDQKSKLAEGISAEIIASPRVGVDYAGEDADRPWRFRLKGSKFTSPAK